MRETIGSQIARARSGFSRAEKKTICKDCACFLTEENQYPSCRKRGQYVCKKCWNQRFYFAVKKGKYGISLAKLTKILESQDYKCAICESRMTQASMCVDHCHDSGRVRGLLCNACNSGIGMLKDSAEVVYKALDYLRGRALFDLRLVDFGEETPPPTLTEEQVKRREYMKEWRARQKVKPVEPKGQT